MGTETKSTSTNGTGDEQQRPPTRDRPPARGRARRTYARPPAPATGAAGDGDTPPSGAGVQVDAADIAPESAAESCRAASPGGLREMARKLRLAGDAVEQLLRDDNCFPCEPSGRLRREARRLLVTLVRLVAWDAAALGTADHRGIVRWRKPDWCFQFELSPGGSLRRFNVTRPGVPPLPVGRDEEVEQAKDRVWDLAYDEVCGSGGEIAVDFIKPAHQAFQSLVDEGQLEPSDWGLFLEGWFAHNRAFIEYNRDLLDEPGPEDGTDEDGTDAEVAHA
ncbi:MAG: hypothetical protein JXB32_14740 [Deltaproteobacteria bacterium]|nr:hypothetical protein [Deltaproteobacteria bacterium]